MNENEFIEETKKLGIEITPEKLNQLYQFYDLLIEWNQKTNLTRITEKEDVLLKHFYDSLTITKVVDLTKIKTLCDVGTGAGFPGIVLKIVFPNLNITLVDSLQKRVNYLNEIIKQLNLKDIKAIHARGEQLKEKYDLVTARAVANIEKLINYTMHLVDNKGKFVAMKGNIENELTPSIKTKINSKYLIEKIVEFELPKEQSHRALVVIKNKHF